MLMAMSVSVSRDDGRVLHPTAVVVLSLVAVFTFALLPRFFPSPSSALVGKPAPEFALEVVYNGDAGNRMRLSDLRGHTVILDFWATWCGPCQVEGPILDRVARRHKDEGLIVIGINTSDQADLAAAFARQKQLSYPILYDDANAAADRYHVEGLPTLIVINAKGDVVAVRSGVESDSDLDQLVAQAQTR